ncbi:MAG: RsmE family RNA methyltransferase, partial [Bacillota bacterium]|nr:RsmE family RNA methyltransferase [Bacillota bacterium]
MPRFLLSSLKEGWGQLTGEEAHHVVKVQRYRINDMIEVVGDARVFRGVISELQEGLVTVKIEAELRSSEPQLDVTLYQGVVKGDKLELIIQKAVELGVSRIVPVMCRRTIVVLDEKKARERTARWQRIAQEASKQSGRAKVPLIDQPLSLVEALTQDVSQLRVMAYEGGGTTLKACFSRLPLIQTASC